MVSPDDDVAWGENIWADPYWVKKGEWRGERNGGMRIMEG